MTPRARALPDLPAARGADTLRRHDGAVAAALANPDPFAALSPRQREVARLAEAGLTTRQIAVLLGIAVNTASAHLIAARAILRARAMLANAPR